MCLSYFSTGDIISLQDIDKVLNNINFPRTEQEFQDLALRWERKLQIMFGSPSPLASYFGGVVFVGDGKAIEINQPDKVDLKGLDASIFLNRKKFWALIAQAFCDPDTKFLDFEVDWPGATCDVSAYKASDMFAFIHESNLPEWAVVLLDGAYASFGKEHLCPFSVYQLDRAKRQDL